VLAALIPLLVATSAQVDAHKAVADAFGQMGQGKYLPAVHSLESAYRDAAVDDKPYLGNFLAYAYAFVGEVEQAEKLMDVIVPPDSSMSGPVPSDFLDAKGSDALWAIVNAARNRQIVILNESHLDPRCRAFAVRVARELRKLGFEYFAAETFTSSVFDAWTAGYPTLQTGRYSMEPYFGDLVRQAIKLGYKPMNYEAVRTTPSNDWIDSANQRESVQAQNIIDRILKRNPKAKIFVYCGGDHLTEDAKKQADGRELIWMAARLKRATGIDPLTIDQSYELQHSTPSAETPEFRYATGKHLLQAPTVFKLKNGGWAAYGEDFANAVDMQVFHPHDESESMPSWKLVNGNRTFCKITFYNGQRGLIQAFASDEPNSAVPMDQAIMPPNRNSVMLALPNGKYRIVVQDEMGHQRVVMNGLRI